MPKRSEPPFRLLFKTCEAETPLAVLVTFDDGEEVWLPRSQIVGKNPRKGQKNKVCWITNWLARREWPHLWEDDFVRTEEFEEKGWWTVLGCDREDPDDFIETRYLKLVRLHHPDRGGSLEDMQRVNEAYESFKKERGRN